MRRFLPLLLLLACTSTPRKDGLVVVAERMLDVDAGRYVENVAVYVSGDRIEKIVIGRAPDRSYGRVVTLPAGTTLLPGLIDAHTHLAWSSTPGVDEAKKTIEAGFTTVRNLGSDSDAAFALRDRIASGEVVGPRMILSGAGLGPPGGVCPQTFGPAGAVTSADDARAKVRDQITNKHATFIKVCAGGGVIAGPRAVTATELDAATLGAIVAEAHGLGVKVAAHAQGPASIRNAVGAGVDSIEHGSLIDRETALLMREKNVALVPTLARLRTTNAPNREVAYAAVAEAVKAGVPIVLGTDAVVLPHGENAKELAALVEVGLTPLEAIRAATTRAAALLGVKDVGAIRAGAFADLVAFEGDPLADVGALSKPRVVIAGGRVVSER